MLAALGLLAIALPLTVPALILTSDADDDVPAAHSRGIQGSMVRTVELEHVSHIDLIAPQGAAVDEIVTFLQRISPGRE